MFDSPLKRISGVLVALLLICSACSSQTAPSTSISVYANFFGTWKGSDHFLQDSVWIDIPLELTVTPDKRGMRFDYIYGIKGEKGYEHTTKYMTLSPERSEIILQWKDEKKEILPASGLTEFAQAGLGTFSFIWERPQAGVLTDLLCTFTLEKDALSYKWENAPHGNPLKLTAIWKLTRQASNSTAAPP